MLTCVYHGGMLLVLTWLCRLIWGVALSLSRFVIVVDADLLSYCESKIRIEMVGFEDKDNYGDLTVSGEQQTGLPSSSLSRR